MNNILTNLIAKMFGNNMETVFEDAKKPNNPQTLETFSGMEKD